MDNPYQSPQPAKLQEADKTAGGLPIQPEPGMVGQVRIVCILSYIQGGLELLMAAYYLAMAVVLPMIVAAGALEEAGDEGAPPQEFMWIMGGFMAVVGGGMLVVGLLRVYAAYRNYSFRNRILGIVAMALGMATVITCYCAPTAIALAIYGFIVFLNPQTSLAFQFGSQGHDSKEIMASFQVH